MLPRIAKLDREFLAAFAAYVQLRSRQSPILRQIKTHVIHEGKTTRILRSETDSEATNMREASAETRMNFDDIEKADIAYVITKANELADQFETHHKTTLFQTLHDTTEKTGQTINARGEPLTNAHIYEMLSKVTIDFEKSSDGDLTILTAPAMASKLASLDSEIQRDPELRKKFDELMDKKRDEFREREINRNLAG